MPHLSPPPILILHLSLNSSAEDWKGIRVNSEAVARDPMPLYAAGVSQPIPGLNSCSAGSLWAVALGTRTGMW